MASQGWIKLHRELLDKAIWKTSTSEQKIILITLLLMANHEENEWEWNGERYKVQPGQMITSLKSIAEACGGGVTIRNVRTAIDRFEKYGFLTNQSTNKNRLVTIVNYKKYQGEEYQGDKATDKQLTSNRQATDKQLTTNKNDKNDKNDKNERDSIDILNILEQTFDKKISQLSVNKLIKTYGAENVKLLAKKIGESTWLKQTINLNKISKKFFTSILEDKYKDYEKKEEVEDNKYDWYKPLDI